MSKAKKQASKKAAKATVDVSKMTPAQQLKEAIRLSKLDVVEAKRAQKEAARAEAEELKAAREEGKASAQRELTAAGLGKSAVRAATKGAKAKSAVPFEPWSPSADYHKSGWRPSSSSSVQLPHPPLRKSSRSSSGLGICCRRAAPRK